MQINLLPIQEHAHENPQFSSNPDYQESYAMTISFYKRIGFQPPWISYYASVNGELVGAAAYKGKPVNNQVEIAYGVFPQFQMQGIGRNLQGAGDAGAKNRSCSNHHRTHTRGRKFQHKNFKEE